MSAGRFITFEGGEGAGKSTQIGLFCQSLEKAGLHSIMTREPGGTPQAEAIRQLLVSGEPGKFDAMTELLLHYAARRDHVEKNIRPSLKKGTWVVSDRFADSTIAYQGYGHGLGEKKVREIHTMVLGAFKPHLTFILDISVKRGIARAQGRGGKEDRYERMERSFHERLRKGFLKIAAEEPRRCVVIDADQPIEAVHAEIIRHANRKFKMGLRPVGRK